MHFPVFIVGMPRSGTSLVSALLNAHSRLAVTPETHYFTRCWDGPVQSTDHAETLVDCLFEQPGVGDMRLSADERRRIRSAVGASERPTHRTILQPLFDIYREREGKACWGEKTPDHWEYVEVIQETFPEAVFVSIVRDPRDVSLSLRKVPWNQGQTVIDHARRWRDYARRAGKYLQDPDIPFLEIRYEDLLEDAEGTAGGMLDFLDAPHEDVLGAFHRAGTQNVDTSREPWKTKTERPIDSSNRNNWVSEMTQVDRAIVERICGPEMRQKGYPVEGVGWNLSMAAPLFRVGWQTLTGRLRRRLSKPWYLRQ